MSESDTIIRSIYKNNREQIRVTLGTFRGLDVIDLRVFADKGPEAEPEPTLKGVCTSIERLPELREALEEAEVEARRRGLLA